ncbi:MAG: UDP-3-O-[3-hydroxymyristoyl] N-acetylglucosamine deacetylase [Deltaproteobacteria bacterium RBG_13_52_11]|nr:MAG: UDP-3-O-[3-hydroxymyristoyl] N-acetylglucosamine deacetylase [Deltaproteobacteria bacterium RBG_13_52_11]
MAKAKILVVDDEEGILKSIVGILHDEGYETITARDGREALKLYQAESPDALLLDIWMPDMDGIEVLKGLQNIDVDSAVVVISGHGTISTAIKAVKLGAFDFIEKPLSMDILLVILEKALEHRRLRLESKRLQRLLRDNERRQQQFSFVTTSEDESAKPLPPSLATPLESGVQPQRTLKQSMVLYGTGLHSGLKTGMILLPQPPGSGIVFCKLSEDLNVPGHLDYVLSTEFATSVAKGRTVIRTVEHFMAVLHAYRISNLLIKINGEIPIMDGSALDFCRIIEEAGIEEQMAGYEELVVDRRYQVGEESPEGKYIYIEPADTFGVRYRLNYPLPIGEQEYSFILDGTEHFKEEIAPARTFGFLKDAAKLSKMGLAGGGHLHNIILLDDKGVVNTKLRFPDEFVRHKILDIFGDFYLLNRSIKGMVTANMTGHSENIALLREIRKGMGL